MADRDETTLRVFNAAKLFAEKILFPLMEQYQIYQKQSDFGSSYLSESLKLSEDIRDIERFNGLKAMADVCLNLTFAIKSTVYLKNNKEEIKELEKNVQYLDKIRNVFINHKHLFFRNEYKNGIHLEVLDRNYFEKMKRLIQTCYSNTETLMTRNRLLFSDISDEFITDEEIQEQIMKEYTEG